MEPGWRRVEVVQTEGEDGEQEQRMLTPAGAGWLTSAVLVGG